jgi:hypothetical protein
MNSPGSSHITQFQKCQKCQTCGLWHLQRDTTSLFDCLHYNTLTTPGGAIAQRADKFEAKRLSSSMFVVACPFLCPSKHTHTHTHPLHLPMPKCPHPNSWPLLDHLLPEHHNVPTIMHAGTDHACIKTLTGRCVRRPPKTTPHTTTIPPL